ncbi:MAG TPA: PAS domain S-box protein [Candidatus Limnocylindria bacterium]|nr:PAS domain S-box protein [Candidatus Limnocylindria bacterium]
MPSTPGFGEKLRTVFGLSPTILCLTGLADGRVRDANDAFLSTSGYSREEILGRTPLELGLWVDPTQREAGIRELKAGRAVRSMECRFRVKSGEERVTLLSADIVMFDGEACILSALTDITDRTRAEAALRESERRFMVAFHANPLPMSITSLRDHRHLEVNDAAVRHSGYSREELLGHTKPQLGFWVTAEQRDRLLRLLHTEGRVRDLEVTFRTRGGEERQLLVNSEVITFEGEPAVLSVSLDITERKLYEESLRAANQAKDEFLAVLGHELRNPLGTLTNAVAVLERLPGDETMRHVVAIIGRQTGHLGRLVDDLLDVARVTSGKIELQRGPVELHALAGRCLDALAQAGRTGRHTVVLDGEPVYVDGDAARLEQVLNNLMDNALKYTPGGGRVTISTGRAGETAVLRVRDTGQGIRTDLLSRVFDLFVQEQQSLDRSRGGLGLGLALVKRLVELHGGSVAVWSAGPGQGSEFTVRLPVVAGPVAEASRPATGAASAAARSRRVLVVEDSPDARQSLRMLLEMAGHEVETSEDGPSGLAKLEAFRPDVALIDLGLPGMDGYAMAREMRGRPETRAIRLVAVTGYGQADDRRRALAAGFDLHVTKPVDASRLDDMLGRAT